MYIYHTWMLPAPLTFPVSSGQKGPKDFYLLPRALKAFVFRVKKKAVYCTLCVQIHTAKIHCKRDLKTMFPEYFCANILCKQKT